MGAINQKCTIDTHTQKSNPNTTLKMDIKSQEKRTKEEGKKKDLQKQIQGTCLLQWPTLCLWSVLLSESE